MNKGGYQIIDLQGKDFGGGNSFVYPGIYEKVEGTRKAILLSGLVHSGIEFHDMFVKMGVQGTTFITEDTHNLFTHSFELRIQDNDVVTVSPL